VVLVSWCLVVVELCCLLSVYFSCLTLTLTRFLTHMKRALDNSSAVQVASLHELNKLVRQHSVEKNDAIEDATKAKGELAGVVKRTDRLIAKLERDVHELAQGKLAMAANVEDRVQLMNLQARAMARDKRQLELDQADFSQLKVIHDKQLESLTYQRDLTQTERKKIKTTHFKALEEVKTTSEHEKQVPFFGVPCICLNSLAR
jgi:hypothetical protein